MLGMGRFTEGGAKTWVGQVSVHTVTSPRADSVLNSIIEHPLSLWESNRSKEWTYYFYYGYMKLIN